METLNFDPNYAETPPDCYSIGGCFHGLIACWERKPVSSVFLKISTSISGRHSGSTLPTGDCHSFTTIPAYLHDYRRALNSHAQEPVDGTIYRCRNFVAARYKHLGLSSTNYVAIGRTPQFAVYRITAAYRLRNYTHVPSTTVTERCQRQNQDKPTLTSSFHSAKCPRLEIRKAPTLVTQNGPNPCQ